MGSLVVAMQTLVLKFIFDWRILALQCCVGFCHEISWIRLKYASVPSFLNLALTPTHPTLLGHPRVHGWGPPVTEQLPTGYQFTYGNAYVSVLLSQSISGSTSLTRGRTRGLCVGSTRPQSLEHQESHWFALRDSEPNTEPRPGGSGKDHPLTLAKRWNVDQGRDPSWGAVTVSLHISSALCMSPDQHWSTLTVMFSGRTGWWGRGAKQDLRASGERTSFLLSPHTSTFKCCLWFLHGIYNHTTEKCRQGFLAKIKTLRKWGICSKNFRLFSPNPSRCLISRKLQEKHLKKI